MTHSKGFCICGMYHKYEQSGPVARSASELIGLYAVKPIERDPITGKPVRNTVGLKPQQIYNLLFREGDEVWSALEDPEKALFASFIRECWVQANADNSLYIARKFYGEMLINLHTNHTPVHGEYAVE
jgi:hypothetical protein